MIAHVTIDASTCDWLVRNLIDWGYLDACDCLDDECDEFDLTSRVALGHALGRAIPRLLLEAKRNR